MRKNRIQQLATTSVALGFLVQTIGMAFRWYEAGLVEVEAFEQSTGEILEGAAYLKVITQHPPWSNLYEIMGYMGWGLVLVFLVCEVKWRPRFVGVFALLLALTALGVASLTDGKIKPLVPALKSWWIMIHVISASIAYACGTLAAIASFFYLIKDEKKVPLRKVAAGVMGVSAFICIILGRGWTLFSTQSYQAKGITSPGVGWLLLLTIGLSVLVPLSTWWRGVRGEVSVLYFTAYSSLITTITLILINGNVNIWDMALFSIILLGQTFVGLALLWPQKIRALIPSADELDHIAYSNILVAFTLMAVVLVTGALWAHYAWGRYWGWDPKETGALVIWITYALYLHTRIAYGWAGPRSAMIAVFGFFVILAGFLGVNLGWFADGLHSYGSS
ncbi:MAG: c-type cytochrome biogenesis protein CcsB [Deltaproteobacteria bacterium]|nr:c-type cytochrome biogenesis protein CcsB [Deltaproteobacteria bacterium]